MAIDEHYIELINADIDGELDDAERSQLRTWLAANAEGQAVYDELAALCSTLDHAESLEPPPHLKYAIMESFKPRPATVSPEPFWRQVFQMPVFRHAAAFAAGVFMTFALVNSNQISNHAFDDVTGLVGTISDSEPALTADNSINLTRQDIAGTVSVHESGSLTVVDFNLSTKEPVDIIAGYPERDLWFRGFAQLENDGANVVADKGEVRVRIEGRNRYAIYLQQASNVPAAIHLRFFAGGNLVHEAELSLGRDLGEPSN